MSYHIISYHEITWVSKMSFFKSSGDHFFDPNDCRLSLRKGSRIFLRSLLTDFFPGPQNGPKCLNIVKNCKQIKKRTSCASTWRKEERTNKHKMNKKASMSRYVKLSVFENARTLSTDVALCAWDWYASLQRSALSGTTPLRGWDCNPLRFGGRSCC